LDSEACFVITKLVSRGLLSVVADWGSDFQRVGSPAIREL
jgi:hypothetical protein